MQNKKLNTFRIKHKVQLRQQVATSLPVTHADLLAAGVFGRYSFPVPASRRSLAALGYTLLPGLLNEFQVKPFIDPEHVAFSVTSPGAIMRITDVLQRCHAAMAPAHPQLLGEVHELLGGMHRHYSELVADNLKSSQRFFDADMLIRCMVFAGFLRDSQDFRLAARQAIEATIANQDHRKFFLDSLDSGSSDRGSFRSQNLLQ